MLFDLKGRRRRVVQVVYLMLAVLMGGGLVFFGIGGDVSGGLFDAFSERGGGSGNQIIEDRIDENQKKLDDADPKNDGAALKAIVRDRYSLAADERDPDDGRYTDDGMEQLAKADEAWKQYIEAKKKPEASLAALMLQVYDQTALNKPAEGATAAEIIADEDPTASAYVQLARFATLAGQKRKATLAKNKALDLAKNKAERQQVEAFIATFEAQQSAPPTPQG